MKNLNRFLAPFIVLFSLTPALGKVSIAASLPDFASIAASVGGDQAEVFSIGFGPKLWAKKFGETEFRLAAIPLGGFVKLLGRP